METPIDIAKSPTLLIQAQPFFHSDAVIVGNRSALEGLRAAIDEALKATYATYEDADPGDGEVYAVRIVLANRKTIESLVPPYTDRDMCPVPAGAHSAEELYHKRARGLE